MLAAPVLPLPQGTPPPHHRRYNVTEYEQRYSYRNTPIPPDTPPPPTILTQPSESLFLYKNNTTRPCNSAPTPPITKLEDFDNSSSSSSSSSCFSASSSSPPHSSSTSKLARKKSSTSRPCCFGCCSCPSCSSVASFFFGHCPAFTSWSTSFASHSRFLYLLLFFLESSLRSIGSITFCSNPLSGLLIFIGMLIACPHVAFIAYLTSLAGLETAIVFLHIPLEEVRSGVVTFNTFLIGIVLGILCPPTVLLTNPTIIITAISVGILSLIIWKGLNTLLPSHYEFPLLNAPFHITILLYIYSGLSSLYEPPTSPSLPPPAMDSSVANLTAPTFSTSLEIPPSMTFVEPLNWQNLFYGVLLAPGPVFGTNTLFTSSLVHLAVFLYSPILLLQCLQGSLIGTLLGSLLVNPEDYSNLYNGSWGYNPLFTTAAIGGFFVVLNFHSWLLSLAGAVITTLLYSAMVKLHLPAMGIPFMLITWLLIPSVTQSVVHSNINPTACDQVQVAISNDEKGAETNVQNHFIRLRLCQITTPEQHRQQFLPKKREKRKISSRRKSRKSVISTKSVAAEDTKEKNGVMNKYKSSISEFPQGSPGEIPAELSSGVERHSILPL